jgi:Na+/proline symporter
MLKKPAGSEEFNVGDRRVGWGQTALSIAATWVWAPALFVSAERAYTQGVIGLFWFLVPNVLCLVLFIPFAQRIRERAPRGVTLSRFMGDLYGPGARRAYWFQLAALSGLSTGVNLLAGGQVLALLTGVPFFWVTVLLAAIALSYSITSGLKASIVTDAVQMVLIIGVCVLLVAWALAGNGVRTLMGGLRGVGGAYGALFSRSGLEVFLSFGLPTTIGLLAGPFGDQNFWQRAFAVEQRAIGKAFAVGAVTFGLVPLAMGMLGFIARGAGFVPHNVGVVNFELVTSLFPAWVLLPFVFMLVSGLLSTVDSNLCAAAALTSDFSGALSHGRLAMVGNLLVGIAIANIPHITITELFLFYGTLRASTFAPTVLTLADKRIGRVGTGVCVSLVVGLPVFAYGTLTGAGLAKTMGSVLGLGLSGVVCLLAGRRRAGA